MGSAMVGFAMGRLVNRLTPRGIAALRAPGVYADGNRLYLRARADGQRHDGRGLNLQWVFMYRWGRPAPGRNSNTVELGLGGYPATSLKVARDKAKAANEQLAAGVNPKDANDRNRALPTFEETALALQARDIAAGRWSSEKGSKLWLARLQDYAFPVFGGVRIDRVNANDIEAALKPVWHDKFETATKLRGALGDVMKYAIAKRWRSDDPARFIDALLGPQNRQVAHHPALLFGQVAGALDKIKASDAEAATKLAHEFLAHTATRSANVREMLWEEVKNGYWTIPVEKLKAKRMKDKAPHRIKLTPQMLAILEEAAKLNPERKGLVFPSITGKALSDNTLSKLMRDLEIAAVPHGYRTSFRAFARHAGFADDVSRLAIDHKKKASKEDAAYERYKLEDEQSKLFAAWSAYLVAGPQADNVIEFAQRVGA